MDFVPYPATTTRPCTNEKAFLRVSVPPWWVLLGIGEKQLNERLAGRRIARGLHRGAAI